jgi:hypothetical protein
LRSGFGGGACVGRNPIKLPKACRAHPAGSSLAISCDYKTI